MPGISRMTVMPGHATAAGASPTSQTAPTAATWTNSMVSRRQPPSDSVSAAMS